MKSVFKTICAAVFILAATGCAGHLIRINGHCRDTEKGKIPSGATFFVVENNTVDPFARTSGIKGTVAKILESKGYKTGNFQDADYFLAIGYGVGSGQKVLENVQMAITFAPFADVVAHNPGTSSPTVQPVNIAPMTMDHTQSVFEIWLTCKLIDGKKYRETKQLNDIWTGRASVIENYAVSVDNMLNEMIPLVFDRFCENADTAVMVKSGNH